MNIEITYGLPSSAAKIRQAVFVEEQGFKDEFDDTDPVAWHIVVYIDSSAAATGRTFSLDGGKTFKIGRVAVLEKYRKLGLGRVVMAGLEGKVQELGGVRLELSAQIQAQGFYQKLGYTQVGQVYLDEHCPHITMVKQI